MSELESILDYLETTSLEPHDDYVSEFSYKDQKTLWKDIKELQQENQELKKLLDYALKLLSDYNTPCDIDGFMDKHSDYCQINCGVDEEIFKNCWLLYIEDKLKEGNK